MFALILSSLLTAGPVRPGAVQWGDFILLADGDGTLSAFASASLDYDAAFSKQLNGDGLLALVVDEAELWGFDGRRVFTWDSVAREWMLRPTRGPPAECLAFAVVAHAPVCVTAKSVYRFTTGTVFEAPPFKGQVSGRGFGESPHAVAVSGDQLAIGTGFGEWGEHLWLLDLSTGEWAMFNDTLGNAVGIAWTGDAWAVAWSMSHFEAHTRVRLHGRDAQPRQEGPMTRGSYLRKLTWDLAQGVVVGLERDTLVRVTKKVTLEKLFSIGKVAYAPERHAVGVAPGIAQLMALGEGRYLVIPTAGPALVATARRTVPLSAPTPDAGRR
jgi:hypothetical protein